MLKEAACRGGRQPAAQCRPPSAGMVISHVAPKNSASSLPRLRLRLRRPFVAAADKTTAKICSGAAAADDKHKPSCCPLHWDNGNGELMPPEDCGPEPVRPRSRCLKQNQTKGKSDSSGPLRNEMLPVAAVLVAAWCVLKNLKTVVCCFKSISQHVHKYVAEAVLLKQTCKRINISSFQVVLYILVQTFNKVAGIRDGRNMICSLKL